MFNWKVSQNNGLKKILEITFQSLVKEISAFHPPEMKIAISLVIIFACIAINLHLTKKTIEEGVWLVTHNYPKALGAHPLAVYLTWLISVTAIYANLPFSPPIKALISLVLFVLGVLVEGKLVSCAIEKQVKEVKQNTIDNG